MICLFVFFSLSCLLIGPPTQDMAVVAALAVALGKPAEELNASAQSAIDFGAATVYEAQISVGLRKQGIAQKIAHFGDAAVTFRSRSSQPASKLVHPALLQAALSVSAKLAAKSSQGGEAAKPGASNA